MAKTKKIVTDEDVINQLTSIEYLCDHVKQQCYALRKKVSERGQLSAPAPKGGAAVITMERQNQLILNRTRRFYAKSK